MRRIAGFRGAVTRRWGRTPLRVRLVAGVLLLVFVALAGSAAAATATMRTYLIGRVDNQLAAVADHPGDLLSGGTTAATPTGSSGKSDGNRGDAHGAPSAFVTEVARADGTALYGPNHNLVRANEPLPDLPRVTAARSAADGSREITVRAVSGNASWRVLIEPVTLTDGTAGTLLIAQSLGDVDNTIDQLTALLAGIGAAAVVLIGGVAYVLVRVSLRPLRAVEHTAASIAAGDLTHRVPAADERTEVGRLADALNTMLGKIETAFAARAESERVARSSSEQARRSEERMRRFVADASHELRTPLTTIRGFAELFRQGAVEGPEQLSMTMRRIEDEAARMGLLVEDLLMLARLDAERPLAREQVDLLALAGDAMASVRATAPGRPVSLVVGCTDPPPVVTGDDARLRQVFGNLLANAVKHTPPESPVVAGIGSAPGVNGSGPVAVLTVTDRGPGLPPDAAARVFERFYRADTVRGRDDGGSGLGLAIVAAIVHAHGGRVEVETSPGAGACFRVELPLTGL